MTGILGGLIGSIKKALGWGATTEYSGMDLLYESINLTGDTYLVFGNDGLVALNTSTNSGTIDLTYGSVTGVAKGLSGLVGFVTEGGQVVRTSNGTSLTLVGTVPANNSSDIATNGNGTWIVVYDSTSNYRTSTNNLSSMASTTNPFGTSAVDEVNYLSGATLFSAFVRGSTTYFTSSTGTGSWTSRTLPFTLYAGAGSSGYKNTCSSATFLYAYDSSKQIWRTSDLINWTNLGNPASGFSEDVRRLIANGSNVLMQTKLNESLHRTWYSKDAGATWDILPYDGSDSYTTVLGATTSGYSMANSGDIFFSFYNTPAGATDKVTYRKVEL